MTFLSIAHSLPHLRLHCLWNWTKYHLNEIEKVSLKVHSFFEAMCLRLSYSLFFLFLALSPSKFRRMRLARWSWLCQSSWFIQKIINKTQTERECTQHMIALAKSIWLPHLNLGQIKCNRLLSDVDYPLLFIHIRYNTRQKKNVQPIINSWCNGQKLEERREEKNIDNMKLIENYSPSNLSPKTGGGNVLLDHLLTIVYPHSNDKIGHIAIVSPFECIR